MGGVRHSAEEFEHPSGIVMIEHAAAEAGRRGRVSSERRSPIGADGLRWDVGAALEITAKGLAGSGGPVNDPASYRV